MKRVAISLFAAAFSASASAATVSFDFGGPNVNLGPTETYTDSGGSGLQVFAAGFDAANAPTDLYGKNLGADEIGLGLNNDPSGDHEIFFGFGYVQLDVSDLFGKVTDVKFATNSTTQNEQWTVFGSNTSGSLGVALLSGTTEGVSTALPGFGSFRFYDFVSTSSSGGQNYLLQNLTAVAVPEPATWAAMLFGFGLAGMAMRHRRRIAPTAT